MKTSRSAFTLIELLTVIAIIAILMGLLFPVVSIVLQKAKEAQARSNIQQALVAIGAFNTAYSRFPDVGTADSDGDLLVTGTANEKLYNILAAKKDNVDAETQNPRREVFMEVTKKVTSPKNGFYGYTPTSFGVFYDPFGNPYEFFLDGNYDHQVKIPWATHNQGEDFSTTVLGFTAGKNMTADNPKKDDITSW